MLPASDMIMFGLPCRCSSFTHVFALAKLSALLMSNTMTAAAAPLFHRRPVVGHLAAQTNMPYTITVLQALTAAHNSLLHWTRLDTTSDAVDCSAHESTLGDWKS